MIFAVKPLACEPERVVRNAKTGGERRIVGVIEDEREQLCW